MNAPTSTVTPQLSVNDVFRMANNPDLRPINLSIGNPNLPPPPAYYRAMQEVMEEIQAQKWNAHGYVVEADPFGLSDRIAKSLSDRFGVAFEGGDVHLSVGATGALDVIFKTLLEQGGPLSGSASENEVIVFAPYFVEYLNIIRTNGGKPVVVHTNQEFGLAGTAIESVITPSTRAVLVNSPNNPTGAIYSHSELQTLTDLIRRKEREYRKAIFVIEDSVYDSIKFSDKTVPTMARMADHYFRVNSYSKSLSLAGERIGYFAVHPQICPEPERKKLREALSVNTRMRVVHAPLFQHRILARLPVDCSTDILYYQRNVEKLYECLKNLGYGIRQPRGTFYLWAILPETFKNEIHFRSKAMSGPEPLLYLPGHLFGAERYDRCIRFSVCVSYNEIERACRRLIEISALNDNEQRNKNV